MSFFGGVSIGELPLGALPSGLSLAVGDPLPAFLANPQAEKIFLLELAPHDSTVPGTVNVYLSNTEFQTLPSDTLSNQLFQARLERPYDVQTSILNSGRPGGYGMPTFGDVTALDTDGELRKLLGYQWGGRAATERLGGRGFSYAQFAKIFGGSISGIAADGDTIALGLSAAPPRLQRPLQTAFYKGYGACIRLNGSTQYASATLTCTAGSMTMSVVARPAVASQTGVLNNWRNGSAAGLRLIYQNLTHFTFAVRNDAATLYEAIDTATIVVGQLYHIEGVLDLTAMKAYLRVDGKTVAEIAITGTFNTVLGTFAIGKAADASFYFSGDFDEPRHWNFARTEAQTKADKDRQLIGTETGLVDYWKCDEYTGTSAANSVGGGTALTLTGTPTWVSSLEGSSELVGTSKPIQYGYVFRIEPVLVDSTKLIYQVSDGPINSVASVEDRGVVLTSDGDTTDLWTATITAGRYKTDISRGLIRLQSLPAGKVLVTVEGDKTGGTYVSNTAAIAKRILTGRAGLAVADIDDDAFTALSTAQGAVVGLSVDDLSSPETLVGRLLDGIGGYWTYLRDGRITVGRVLDPSTVTPTGTVADSGILQGTLQRLLSPPVVHQVTTEYARYWETSSADELAGAVTAAQRADLALRVRSASSPAASLTTYLDAEPLTVAGLFKLAADAQTEGDRQAALHGAPRVLFQFTFASGLFLYQIGDVITLQSDLFPELEAGKDMLVVSESSTAADHTLTVWG